MATADEEKFLRSSLLLVKGTLYIAKEVLIRQEQKEIWRTGRDLNNLLKAYKHKLEHEFKNRSQRKILFPKNGKTEVEKWDISLMTGVLLIIYQSTLSADERIAVRHIKHLRNDIFAHTAAASLSDYDYTDLCRELKKAYDTLASGCCSEIKGKCDNIVETCLNGPLDMKSHIEQLKRMSETDDMFREILKKIDTTIDCTRENILRSERNICEYIRATQMTKEDVTEAILEALKKQPCGRIIKVVDSELKISGNDEDQHNIDLAEKIITTVIDEATRRATTAKENARTREVIQEILDEITSQTGLKPLGAKNSCIRLKSETNEQLYRLNNLMKSKDMQARLNELAASLSRELNTKGQLRASLSLSLQCLQSIFDELEENLDGLFFTKTEEMSSQAYLPASEMEEMEKLQIFQTPLCLIKSETDGKLSVVEETMSQLEEIRFGVNVIAITGPYRTGKSYLMTRLAHVSSGYSLGNTTESKTKGIWVWCKRHPTQSNQVLVLLDTEGLGDVRKGDIQHDNKIFTLAALLSSTLVYNMMGAFNQDAIEKLTFITEMSKNMKVGEQMSGDKCLDFVLPRFVLCLHDLFLELEAEGRKLTPDEYLENCLKSKQVKTQEDEKYNRPRECIRRYFTRRRVFTFDLPGRKKVMSRLESAHDDELAEEFVEDTVKFTSYIFQCEPKMLLNRQLVTGSMLAELTRAYVKAMREGSLPCVDDAMTTMARKENETMVKKAVSDFEEMMAGVQLPKYNCQELLEINFSNQKYILTTLVKGLVFDDDNEAKKLAERQMNDIARSYERKNDEQLQKICTEKLEDFYKPIDEKISKNDYSMSGGYQIYKKDMSELEEKYSEELQHVAHVVRMKVLKSFLDKKRKDEQKILANDQQLTEKEKEEELKEREAISEKRLKESQDSMLREFEKLKLDHEENIRRMREEQRQKEEADLKMNMNAIMEAREEAYREELKKENERLKAESNRGVLGKAWDYFFRT